MAMSKRGKRRLEYFLYKVWNSNHQGVYSLFFSFLSRGPPRFSYGFRIRNPMISDSTSKIFLDFGFQKQKFHGFRSGFFYTGNSREGQRLEKRFRDNHVMFYYDSVAWRATKKIESQEKMCYVQL